MSATPASTTPETAEQVATRMRLEPHPEGGWFARWYTSAVALSADLPRQRGYVPGTHTRACATAIHYLLPGGGRSALHAIRGDELWLWHGGGPLVVVELVVGDRGALTVRRTTLGPDPTRGHVLTHAVAAGAHFGAYAPATTPYALVSCVVAPGFDFADWEMRDAAELPGVLLAQSAAAAAAATKAAATGDAPAPPLPPAELSADVAAVIGYLARGGTDPLPTS